MENVSEELNNEKWTDCKYYLKYLSSKDNQLIFKYSRCNKSHNKDFNKDLIKKISKHI